jgi:hypothetical protein
MRQRLDTVIEVLESLGFTHISLNDYNDTEEFENLCERIKQSLYEAYKDTFAKLLTDMILEFGPIENPNLRDKPHKID